MMLADQRKLAAQFKQLHLAKELLVLPNAWDTGSAVIFEKAGFSAIGTTSAGIAYSLGYPDGEEMGLEAVLESASRILKRITVPLSVDIETGYSHDVKDIVDNVRQLIQLGAVGINIEDGVTKPSASLSDRAKQCELIGAIAELKQEMGIPFVINARTDTYWLAIGSPETRLDSTLERASAYAGAGADCIFVPGKLERDAIQALASDFTLNVIALPDGLSMAELEALGVARLSLGSSPARAALGLTQVIANELRMGKFATMYQNALDYDSTNALFET